MDKIKPFLLPVAIFLIVFGIILIIGSIAGFANEHLDEVKDLSQFRSLYDLAKSFGAGDELSFQDYLTYHSVVLLVFGIIDILLGGAIMFIRKKL